MAISATSKSCQIENLQVVEDIFDVVDERDRVIGSAPRRWVHRTKLLHRAVHILVHDGRGRVFLQKRSSKKDSHPDKWDSSASGHVDTGEDYLKAAVREMHEEIGLLEAPEALVEIGRLKASAATDQEFMRVYRVRSEGPFTLNPEEISEGRFWEVSEIREACRQRPGEFATAFKTIVGQFL